MTSGEIFDVAAGSAEDSDFLDFFFFFADSSPRLVVGRVYSMEVRVCFHVVNMICYISRDKLFEEPP